MLRLHEARCVGEMGAEGGVLGLAAIGVQVLVFVFICDDDVQKIQKNEEAFIVLAGEA